jgi:hypothetical protein
MTPEAELMGGTAGGPWGQTPLGGGLNLCPRSSWLTELSQIPDAAPPAVSQLVLPVRSFAGSR